VTRARAEDGFTLVELLVGLAIGSVVLLGLFDVIDASMPAGQRVADRTVAQGRGRAALERVLQDLRSAVCVPDAAGGAALLPPLVSAGDNQVTFFVSMPTAAQAASPSLVAYKRQVIYDPATKTLTEKTWNTDGSPPPAGVPATRQLAAGLTANGQANSGAPSAFFGYYAADTDVGTGALTTSGMTAAQLASISRVSMGFRIGPQNASSDPNTGSDFYDDVTLRLPPSYASGAIAGGPLCRV
jgi:prepilin-type N-terminal cleavage/methylation domain-containing protein